MASKDLPQPFAGEAVVRYATAVKPDNLLDATLLLIGHGSTVNADSSASVLQHAAALRQRDVFAEVLTTFWKVAPFVPSALARARGRQVFVVPFFVSEGWFTEQAIPEALGLKAEGQVGFERRQMLDGKEMFYCQPIGTHPRMTDVILARACEVVRWPRVSACPTAMRHARRAVRRWQKASPNYASSRRVASASAIARWGGGVPAGRSWTGTSGERPFVSPGPMMAGLPGGLMRLARLDKQGKRIGSGAADDLYVDCAWLGR